MLQWKNLNLKFLKYELFSRTFQPCRLWRLSPFPAAGPEHRALSLSSRPPSAELGAEGAARTLRGPGASASACPRGSLESHRFPSTEQDRARSTGGAENYENDTRGTISTSVTQKKARETVTAQKRRCTALLAVVPDDHAESPTCTAGFASSLSSVFVPRACTCPTTPSPPPRGTGYGQAPSTRLLENCTLLRLEGPGPQLCPPGQVHKLGLQSLAPTLTAQHHFISATFPKCSHSQMREVQL